MTSPLVLLPAVDIKSGQAVRLSIEGQTSHGSPGDVVADFQAAGAEWIHLVDLDAAFQQGDNREILVKLINEIDLPVQLSGGISDAESLRWALSTAAARINISTAGLVDLSWIVEALRVHGERLAISLDVEGDRLISRGSRVDAGDLTTVLKSLNDAHYLVVTDNQRDGNLRGPNLELLDQVRASTSARVIASGGIATLEDIDLLRQHEIFGAIIGKALYAGAFTLSEALTRSGSR